MKRLLDFVIAAVALAALMPVMLLIAFAVFMLSGPPIFFTQDRIGRFGRPFPIYKFRTMSLREPGQRVLDITVGGDSRITVIGRYLRKTKLDELPQLWNVLRGDMRLVGPRPEVPRFVALYTPEQRRVLTLHPGITDPASLAFLDEERVLSDAADPERHYIEEIMPAKITAALRYAEQSTMCSDLSLILETVRRTFFGRRIAPNPRAAPQASCVSNYTKSA